MKTLAAMVVLTLLAVGSVPALGQAPGNLQPVRPPELGASVGPAVEKPVDVGSDVRDDEEMVSIIVAFDDTLDGRDLELASGGKAIYRYQEILNGVALILPRKAIPSVASLAGVTGVYHDRLVIMQNDASPPEGGPAIAWEDPSGLGGAGEGVVIGVIDSGIWPEDPAFSDPDPSGKPYPAPSLIPGDQGFGGRVRRSTCDFGVTEQNPADAPFACNNKLIGAYRFMDAYDALIGLEPGEFASARDSHGGGTHAASVAAGNAGQPGGLAGVAPRAHIIAYRTAGGPAGSPPGAYFSDLAAAIEQAILDGVDVLVYSAGGGQDPYREVPSLALMEAYGRGVFVAAPAGNEGPSGNTVGHRAPWVLTAAASAPASSGSASPAGPASSGGPSGIYIQLGGPLGLAARTDALVTGTLVVGGAGGSRIATFSSRGGPEQSLGISKPDLSAPGVGVLGAGDQGGAAQALSGTGVSAAHLGGAGAVLKYLHPGWDPGQIQSALMTSARSQDLYLADGSTLAGPFETGSGDLDLAQATRVSVTISALASHFANHEKDLWNANYPSLYLPAMPGRVRVLRRLENTWHEDRKWVLTARQPADVSIAVPNQVRVPANSDETIEIVVDARDVPVGEVRHATIEFQEEDLVLRMPVTLVREQPPVSLDTGCSQTLLPPLVQTTCLITATNHSTQDAAIVLADPLPERLAVIPESVEGASLESNVLSFSGTLVGAVPSVRLLEEPPLYGYVPLAGFGFEPAPCPDNCDDGGFVVDGLDFVYQDIHYDQAIWSVNGTLELGTSSGVAASGANTTLPDAAIPNNLLAPWWTDLDLSRGGEWYLGKLTDGEAVYDVFEWHNLPRYDDRDSRASFQIWLARGTNLGWFAYGEMTGDLADGTVGVEGPVGTLGQTVYHGEAGSGVLPSGDLYLDQNSSAPGQTHVISFDAQGAKRGRWQNCVRMEGDLWGGEAIACFSGQVME